MSEDCLLTVIKNYQSALAMARNESGNPFVLILIDELKSSLRGKNDIKPDTLITLLKVCT